MTAATKPPADPPIPPAPEPARVTAVVPALIGERGVQLANLDEMRVVAQLAAQSGMFEKRGIKTAAQAFVVMQTGMEAGLTAMASMLSICIVKERPRWDGKALVALIRRSPVCKMFELWNDGQPYEDAFAGVVRCQRTDMPAPIEIRFTVADAKQAGLWERKSRDGEPMTWSLYPKDMLIWRAVTRAADRYFSDVGLGLVPTEVARDYDLERRDDGAYALPTGPPPGRDPLLDAAAGPVLDVTPSAGSESTPSAAETDRSVASPAEGSEPAPESGVGTVDPPRTGELEAESEGAAPSPAGEVPEPARSPIESNPAPPPASASEAESPPTEAERLPSEAAPASAVSHGARPAPASWREDPRFTRDGDDGPMSPVEQQQLVDLMAERKMQLSSPKTTTFLARILGRDVLKRPGDLSRAEFYRIVAVLKPAALPKERQVNETDQGALAFEQ